MAQLTRPHGAGVSPGTSDGPGPPAPCSGPGGTTHAEPPGLAVLARRPVTSRPDGRAASGRALVPSGRRAGDALHTETASVCRRVVAAVAPSAGRGRCRAESGCSAMSFKRVPQGLEQDRKARLRFVQTVAEQATPQNIETLQNAGAISLLSPLLDVVPIIQQTAALALGRLASYSDNLAEAVVKGDILSQLVYSLVEQNCFYKKAAALCAVGKHSLIAQAIVDCGPLDALVTLEGFDPGVKEAAAWALECISRHNAELSQAVVDAGAVPFLVLCIQESEIALKRIAASALSDISKHFPELAQTVVDTGAIAHLTQMILSSKGILQHQVLSAIHHIAKLSVDLAEMVVEAEIFPVVLSCLKKHEEKCWHFREIVKHTLKFLQLIVNMGGLAAVTDYIGSCKENAVLPGITMLGYIAAHSENLAMAAIIYKGVPQLSVPSEEPEDRIKAAAARALGQIGRHSSQHARAVAVTSTLPVLLPLYVSAESSEDLQMKGEKAIKRIVGKCIYLPALEPFLYDVSSNTLNHVLGQFSKHLPHDSKEHLFVMSDGLRKLQEIQAESGSLLQEYISSINSCYPEEVVRYHSPGYSDRQLQRVDSNQPLTD
ncbi:LOW QUALITY PROTEIN: sperm-associated antigen 6 [Erethizon dorsatum]